MVNNYNFFTSDKRSIQQLVSELRFCVTITKEKIIEGQVGRITIKSLCLDCYTLK